MKPQTFWQRLARAVQDRSFIIGSILVAFLVVVAVLGPELAPHSPFVRERIQYVDGKLGKAPFPPSDNYRLGTDDQGRDMLSLLLHGARQTLAIAMVSTVVRLILGLILGTLAGWWPGGLFDRMVMAVVEFLAAIPGLILAIIIVLAVGIHRGQIAFIAALSLVGWGEITQIMRGHVLTIRKRLYIEAARSVGLSSAEILSRHVLPNLLSTLLALAALEMGGVLLLLGELGFVHIFVGGGGRYVSDAMSMGQVIHYFEIPDWGAMLGTSWRWFRSYPWLPLAPALAFFVAIVSFNLFGYGLQRFIERGRFHPSGWSVIRFFAVVALLLLGARQLLASSSIESQFARQASQFNIDRVFHDIAFFSDPQLEGRPSGPGGGYWAAGYIAAQYEEMGLTPLVDGTHFQRYTAPKGRITTLPSMKMLDASGQTLLELSDGLSIDPWQMFESQGIVKEELVVAANVDRVTTTGVLLLLNPDEELYLRWTGPPYAAILRLVPDDQLSDNVVTPPYRASIYRPDFPNLLIGESAARQLLAEVGLDLEELQAKRETGEPLIISTGMQVQVQVGLVYEDAPAVNVIGYFPAADIKTQGQRILVITPYTGPPPRGDVIYPGADENASGVAVMMEIARLWNEQKFLPKRTVVFMAVDEYGGDYFSNHPIFPTSVSDTWTVISLHGLGAGQPKLARYEMGAGLARIFDESARRFRVSTENLEKYGFFFSTGTERMRWGGPGRPDPMYTGLAIIRPGDAASGTPSDTIEHIDQEQLKKTGQALTHYLMVLSSR